MNLYRIASIAAIGIVVWSAPAFAGPSPAAPGPIAGVGLTAIALVGGAFWVGRKFFAGKK